MYEFKNLSWKIRFSLILIFTSFMLYSLEYLLFPDYDSVLFYIGMDVAFIPLDIIIVVLIVEGLINKKEKENVFYKLNMVIGSFFSEVGTDLLAVLIKFDKNSAEFYEDLNIHEDWKKSDFKAAIRNIRNNPHVLNKATCNLDNLDDIERLINILEPKKDFINRLIENPIILEHESFSDLLLSIYHLQEEITYRYSNNLVCDKDYQHIIGDVERVYNNLIIKWLQYMHHLSEDYRYMFVLNLEKNPFKEDINNQKNK